jgi:NADH-quinone oxidoreductase subunit M
MKKLVAYSSVSHLGFVVLGIFSLTQAGADGAVYQMLNHGISTGALFMLVGYLYDRRQNYEIAQYGGLATPMPVYSTIFLIITLSSIGLPLLNGFVGEFLTLSGAFQTYMWSAILGVTGVIWSAGYMLWMYQRTFYGENWNQANHGIADLNGREKLAVIPLVVMAIVMGLASSYWMKAIDPSTKLVNEAGPNTQSQMSEKIANAK